MQLLSDLLYSGEDPLQASAAPAAKGFGARGETRISLHQQQESRAFASAFDTASRTEISAEPLTDEMSTATAGTAEIPQDILQRYAVTGNRISPTVNTTVERNESRGLNSQGLAVADMTTNNAELAIADISPAATPIAPDTLRVPNAASVLVADVYTSTAADEASSPETLPIMKADKAAAAGSPNATLDTALTARSALTLAEDKPGNMGTMAPGSVPTMTDPAEGFAPATRIEGGANTSRSTSYGEGRVDANMARPAETALPLSKGPDKASINPGQATQTAAGSSVTTPPLKTGAAIPTENTGDAATTLSRAETSSRILLTGSLQEQVAAQSPAHARHISHPQGVRLPSVAFNITIASYTPHADEAAKIAPAAQVSPGTQSQLSVPVDFSAPLASATPAANAAPAGPQGSQVAEVRASFAQSTSQAGSQSASGQQVANQSSAVQGATQQTLSSSTVIPTPSANTSALADAPAATLAPASSARMPASALVQGEIAPKSDNAATPVETADAPAKTVQQSIPGQATGQSEAQQALFTPGSTAATQASASNAGSLARMIADPATQGQALQQVATAIETSHKGSGRMELRLDPPELGRVSIDFRFDGDNRVTAILHADQPETATLMRRSLDVLMRDLASAGFTDVNVTMGSGGRDTGHAGQQQLGQQNTGQQQAERHHHSGGQYPSTRDSETKAQNAPQAYRPAWSADTIDIRL
ncbi:hypothetical protein FF098_000235 [Parvularcula flava]|uniref:Flagellar hook-length control protein FliK n=1 Tax=Aquisalinus luteolus TaxID=1566827 RepID=A0A8J3A110_9PROT|nr:flagellar hook-length control protein FliK [Aquisalinus luteolus]NHK26329.1 hypothetical protein [Aquisalinus luteolus]GGH92004.1 flagellar hook-length control protein FliK [Aquisalinus luteolus]